MYRGISLPVSDFYVAFPFPSVISRFPSSRNFGRKKLISENRDMILPWRGWREWRCTKFEVNRTNIEWVTLPAAPSVSSGDLLPDVRLTSADVRADVTTKVLYEALSYCWRGLRLPQMLEAAIISAKAKLEKRLTVVVDAATLKGKGRPG